MKFKEWVNDPKAATCSLEQWAEWRDNDEGFSEWTPERGHIHNLLEDAIDRLGL